MVMTPRWRFPAALLLIGSLLLSACGGNATPTTGEGGAPTGTAAATPGTSGDGSHVAFKFDPAVYKKNEVEPGAELRVTTWGDESEQQVARDSLARFNQVYPDIKISYEPHSAFYGPT